MEILITLGYIYLALGGLYGFYLLVIGESSIWALPINVLGGPIAVIKALKKAYKETKKFKNPEKYV